MIVLGEMGVNFLVVEGDALALQRLKDEVMHGPECLFGERRSAQAVLIADHYKAEIQILPDERKVLENPFHKFQFSKRINLLVFGFLDECAVAVDEKYLLWFHSY